MAIRSFIANLFRSRELAIDRNDPHVRRRLDKRFVTFGESAAPPLPEVPSLISPREQHYLYWLTSQAYSGQGAVVELGSFLGSSAIALGAGLRDSGFDSRLWCFDRFKWSVSSGWRAAWSKFCFWMRRNALPTSAPRSRNFARTSSRISVLSSAMITIMPPSFELAASLAHLGEKLQIVHAVADSSTVSFILNDRLTRAETTEQALSFRDWTVAEAKQRWATIP
jgi:hypothetical protein